MWSLINPIISPKKFFALSRSMMPWLIIAFLITLSYGLIGGLLLAPADYMQGDGFRIILCSCSMRFFITLYLCHDDGCGILSSSMAN